MGARKLMGASISLGAVTVWGALLGLATTPFLIHKLGIEAYGLFALISIVSSYLLNLEFGFGGATIRFIARARGKQDDDEEAAVISTSMAVFVPGAILSGCVVLFGSAFIVDHFAHGPTSLHQTFIESMELAAPIVGFSFLSSFASSALQGLGQFTVLIITRGAFGTASSALSVAAAAVGGGLTLVLSAQVLVSVTQCFVLLFALGRATKAPLRPRVDRRVFRKMASFGGFVLLAGLGTQAMVQGAPTVLAAYSTTAEVAIFAVPNLVLQQLLGLVAASSFGFLPFVSAASASPDREHVAAIYRANLRMTIILLAPVLAYLSVFGLPLLSVWIDRAFGFEAVGPLRLLAAAVLLIGLSAPPSDVARGFGRAGVVAFYSVVTAVLVIVFALLFVPGAGATGAALALTVGLGATTPLFVLWSANQFLGLDPLQILHALRGPVLGAVGVAAVYLAGLAISATFVSAIVAGLVGTALYIFVTFTLTLDSRERTVFHGLVSTPLHLISRRLRRERFKSSRVDSPTSLPGQDAATETEVVGNDL